MTPWSSLPAVSYHYFSTGDGIATKTSSDLLSWTRRSDVFADTPAWFRTSVPRNIWAPDIASSADSTLCPYSVSPSAAIAPASGMPLARASTRVAGSITRAMFCSNVPGEGADGDYNAIDPNVVRDERGATAHRRARWDADGWPLSGGPYAVACRVLFTST